MFKAADLPDTISIFPLPGALLLPRARLPLHIFEPRYLAMLDDALKTGHRLIGMIQPVTPRSGSPAAAAGLQEVGCAGRVTGYSETEDGRYMITLSGVSRFRVIDEISGFTPYRRTSVSWNGFERDLGAPESVPGFDRDELMDLLCRYFTAHNLSTDWTGMKEADDELLINSLCMLCPFEPEEKQALLEAPNLTERSDTLLTLLDFALRGGGEDEVMQ